jgi:putative FmdB family regulatory protein
MPNYDYKCLSCNNRFEVFQSIKDEPLTECSSCGGKVKRIIGAGAGLIFNGSGFYITDYKNKSSEKSDTKNKSEVKQEKISA